MIRKTTLKVKFIPGSPLREIKSNWVSTAGKGIIRLSVLSWEACYRQNTANEEQLTQNNNSGFRIISTYVGSKMDTTTL